MANVFEFNYGTLPEPVALFNFGATSTNFVVVLNGDVIFCRDIPVGGYTFTNELHKSLGLTMPEAESLKLSAAGGQEVADEVHNTMQVALEMVVEEINNSLEFFNATSGGAVISRCLYTGGSAPTPGLIETLSRQTNLHFEILNPFGRIKTPKKFTSTYVEQIAPFVTTALGLGLRKTGEK